MGNLVHSDETRLATCLEGIFTWTIIANVGSTPTDKTCQEMSADALDRDAKGKAHDGVLDRL
jgi:hypothetical protein